MATKWRGMLAPLGVSTGDYRRILGEGIRNRELPLPLKWQREDVEGHQNSVVVASIEEIHYGTVREAVNKGWIGEESVQNSNFPDDMQAAWGSGRLFDDVDPQKTPRLFEDVEEVKILLARKTIGPSLDPGACEAVIALKGVDHELTDEEYKLFYGEGEEGDEGSDIELELLFTEFEIASATLLPIPAFRECRPFELVSGDAVITAAIRKSGWSDMPLAERDLSWDEAAAEKRVSDDAGIGTDSPDWEKYATSFLYQDDEANPETKGAYGFQISDIVNETQTIVPRAVFTVAEVLQGGMGGTKIPQADQDAMKSVVEGLYERMAQEFDDPGIVAPWVEDTASIVAAVTAAVGTATVYSAELFDDPHLSQITPITITEDGRVFGHIATHDVCHVGMPGICTTAPVDDQGYPMFHRYQPEGIPVPVGRITTGGGNFSCSCRQCGGRNDDHACLKLSLGGTIAHHDQLSTVAWVRVGEDTTLNAVWVAGVANPDAALDDLSALSRRKVSGDWRPSGSGLSLVEVLALAREEPGFPLPRFRASADRVSALTAAGVVTPPVAEPEEAGPAGVDAGMIADLVVDRLAAMLRNPGPVSEVVPSTMEGGAPAKPEEEGAPDSTLANLPVGGMDDAGTVVSGLLGEIAETVDGCRSAMLRAEIERVF